MLLQMVKKVLLMKFTLLLFRISRMPLPAYLQVMMIITKEGLQKGRHMRYWEMYT
ncbi:Uncharacterised protein [Mycobacterium tuberculosis]|nr:Uncharacterised protein [Mycobacterium tuberculosis]